MRYIIPCIIVLLTACGTTHERELPLSQQQHEETASIDGTTEEQGEPVAHPDDAKGEIDLPDDNQLAQEYEGEEDVKEAEKAPSPDRVIVGVLHIIALRPEELEGYEWFIELDPEMISLEDIFYDEETADHVFHLLPLQVGDTEMIFYYANAEDPLQVSALFEYAMHIEEGQE